MKRTNKKNKKVTNYQKNRIYRSLIELENVKEIISYDLNMNEMFEKARKDKIFKFYKNNGLICFYNTNFENVDSKLIFMVLEFTSEDKDSIKLNENIVKNIDFLESTLIELDKVEIQRIDYNEQNKHYVFIKAIKKINNVLKNVLETYKSKNTNKGEKNAI